VAQSVNNFKDLKITRTIVKATAKETILSSSQSKSNDEQITADLKKDENNKKLN
jgi:hypothetical protein